MNKNQMKEKENKLRTTPPPPKEGLSEEKIKVNKSSMGASYPPLEGLGEVVPIEDKIIVKFAHKMIEKNE